MWVSSPTLSVKRAMSSPSPTETGLSPSLQHGAGDERDYREQDDQGSPTADLRIERKDRGLKTCEVGPVKGAMEVLVDLLARHPR